MALNQLIAQGGRNIPSPVQRYMETRKQMNQEQQNRLAQQSTMQTMRMQQEKMQMQQQRQKAELGQLYAKSVTPTMEAINKLPEYERQNAWEQAQPEVEKMQYQYGIAPSSGAGTWNQQGADVLISQHGTKPKGAPVNVIYKGKLTNAIVNEAGNYIDEQTRQPLYGAVKAPGRQETAAVTGFKPSDVSKKEFQQLDREEDVYKLVNNLDTLKDFVVNPDYIGGTTGDVIAAGNSMVQQMKQLTGLGDTGDKIATDDLGPGSKGEYSRLRKASMLGDRKSALVIELAYNIAKSFDRGGRVTDADFRFASKLINGSADVQSTLMTIDDFRDRSIKNYNASDQLFSERTKRQARGFTEKKYQTLYGREPTPPAETGEQTKTFRQDLYKEFGVK